MDKLGRGHEGKLQIMFIWYIVSASGALHFLIKIGKLADHNFISLQQILMKNQVVRLMFCLNEKFGKTVTLVERKSPFG